MKPNLPSQARMQRLYQCFKQSTGAAFCREEGIRAAQFTYWCRRFEQESNPTEASPVPFTLAQVSTPIQAAKEPVERKTFSEKPGVAEPTPATPGFTQLPLPVPPATSVHSVFPTPAISTSPLIVLDLAGKGRLEFYTAVEASFLKTLLG